MSSKKWFFMFILCAFMTFGGIMAFNVITDPFGVFGDHFFNWYSYDMTQNPRVAKVAYIDKEHKNYDSYIIGCSSTSSYPVEMLDKYTGDNFYNMIMYGADIYDSTETAKYLIDNYEVKNMFLAVYLSNAIQYNYEADKLLGNLHGKIDGTSPIDFYAKYLFLRPHYGIEKIKAKMEDSYLQNKNDVFNVETGVYDKTKRDIEPIGSIEEYFEAYPVFTNYPYMKIDGLPEIENCLNSIRELKEICDNKGINFKVILTPLYVDYAKYYNQEDIDLFKVRLAEITDFWDFSLSSVSTEPRYFYDEAHFRNCVGEMAIARIYNDKSIYVPKDFGIYITKENVSDKLVKYDSLTFNDTSYTRKVPILIYGKINDVSLFESQVKKIIQNGYEFITFEEMEKYVEGNGEIPKKVAVLSLDKENIGNIKQIQKTLKENGAKATLFITYRDIENSKIDNGSYFQKSINEIDKDVIDIQLKCDEMLYRDESKYIAELRKKLSDFSNCIGNKAKVLWYRNETFDELTEVICKEEGIEFSICDTNGINTLVKGMNQSLRGMKYIKVNEKSDALELLKY